MYPCKDDQLTSYIFELPATHYNAARQVELLSLSLFEDAGQETSMLRKWKKSDSDKIRCETWRKGTIFCVIPLLPLVKPSEKKEIFWCQTAKKFELIP